MEYGRTRTTTSDVYHTSTYTLQRKKTFWSDRYEIIEVVW
jgi:hypothetical protein